MRSRTLDITTDANGAFSGTCSIPTGRLRAISIDIDSIAGVSETQIITLTGFGGTDSFKLTYGGVESSAFVRGTNAQASDLQTALRTLTGDTGLTVSGTTDAGPYTVTFSASFGDPSLLTVTSGVGCTGVVAEGAEGLAVSFASIGRTFLTVQDPTADTLYATGELLRTIAGAASTSYGRGVVVHGGVTVTVEGGGALTAGSVTFIYED